MRSGPRSTQRLKVSCVTLFKVSVLLFTTFQGVSSFDIILIFPVNWLDTGKTLREQNVQETDSLLMLRKYFYDDVMVDVK